MKVYLSSDHGGFELKNELTTYLQQLGYEIEDFGPQQLQPQDDFPLYTTPLAQRVAVEPNSKGIIICRNGVGVAIAANKIKGIRCALSWDPKHAASTRSDDNTNVLALPADYITDEEAKQIAKVWLSTPFSSEERFARRIKEIEELEK